MHVAESPAPDVSPDQDVPCPLCGYNLRGLPEAHCPECGAKFDWPDLLDPTRRLHPYLFEHHPRRNVRSFFRTLFAGWLPGRFWRTLHPAQIYHPGRLVLYWLICVSLCLLLPLMYFGLHGIVEWQAMRSERAQNIVWCRMLSNRASASANSVTATRILGQIMRDYGSVQKYIDAETPDPSAWLALKRVKFPLTESISRQTAISRGNFDTVGSVIVALSLIVWPWCMTALLMMLRASMRQAKVRSIHLLRATIYSSDVFVSLCAVVMLFIVFEILRDAFPASRLLGSIAGPAMRTMLVAPWVSMMILMYRFIVALKRYLHFRHAMAVALSLQCILVLGMMKLLVLVAQ